MALSRTLHPNHLFIPTSSSTFSLVASFILPPSMSTSVSPSPFLLPRLTELALLYCQRIGNSALHEIGKGCKSLETLHLVDCSAIGDNAMCRIAKGCRNLKKLHIRRCYDIGNKGVIAIGKHCKSLTEFSLRFCDKVGDEALIAIGKGCSLQQLNVSGCNKISDAGISAIARGCPQLTHLDISVLQNIGDMTLAELGEGCPMLKDLVLSHCHDITDTGLNHLCSEVQTAGDLSHGLLSRDHFGWSGYCRLELSTHQKSIGRQMESEREDHKESWIGYFLSLYGSLDRNFKGRFLSFLN